MQAYFDTITSSMDYFYLKILGSLVAYFGMVFSGLDAVGLASIALLIIIDALFGIAAAYREGSPITSQKAAKSIRKGTVYMLAGVAGHLVDLTTGLPIAQATMIGFIGVTEGISILENMQRMGYETPKKLLNQLKDFKSEK